MNKCQDKPKEALVDTTRGQSANEKHAARCKIQGIISMQELLFEYLKIDVYY